MRSLLLIIHESNLIRSRRHYRRASDFLDYQHVPNNDLIPVYRDPSKGPLVPAVQGLRESTEDPV